MPTRKPIVPKKADDKEQSERFIQTAQDCGADETSASLERAFKKAVPQRKAKRQK